MPSDQQALLERIRLESGALALCLFEGASLTAIASSARQEQTAELVSLMRSALPEERFSLRAFKDDALLVSVKKLDGDLRLAAVFPTAARLRSAQRSLDALSGELRRAQAWVPGGLALPEAAQALGGQPDGAPAVLTMAVPVEAANLPGSYPAEQAWPYWFQVF
jgi:hypothetical protein